MKKPLKTRAQRVSDIKAAKDAVEAARVAAATAYFATLPAATDAKGTKVRDRVLRSPEEWALTLVSCDVDPLVPLLEHRSGSNLHCPVCGEHYPRTGGEGCGPVSVATVTDPDPVP